MSEKLFRIAIGGEQRLREAVEAKIRQAHQDDFSRAADKPQRVAIEEKIRQEIDKEMKRVSSPFSLWSSH
jgi:hypothetical protein